MVNYNDNYSNNIFLHKHQWNTRWAFARKNNIFTQKKYHCCYGYIINRAFRRIKLFQWKYGLVFHWSFYNKYNITWPLGDMKLLFSCWKYFTRSLRSLVKYFSTLEEKSCISARPCNILYVLPTSQYSIRSNTS